MAKKIVTLKGYVIAEYSRFDKKDNGTSGYTHGAFLRADWVQGFRTVWDSDMNFDSLQEAIDWAESIG